MIDRKYFSFQKSYHNSNEFEVVFNPAGVGGWDCSTDPQTLCDFFNINLDEYLEAAKGYEARIVEPGKKKFSDYKSIRFRDKKSVRKFIKEYLSHYVIAAKLMGKFKE